MFQRKKSRIESLVEDESEIVIDESATMLEPVRESPSQRSASTTGDRRALRQTQPSADTSIGRGVSFEGTLRFEGTARIDGTLRGSVISSGSLEIGAEATVQAKLSVATLIIRGRVKGDVIAQDSVEIHQSGKLRGDLRTPALTVHPGACFNGLCDMGDGST